MTQVRVREVTGTMRVVDGDALLSTQLLERIVEAVLQALAAERRDEGRRRRDVRLDGAGSEWHDAEEPR